MVFLALNVHILFIKSTAALIKSRFLIRLLAHLPKVTPLTFQLLLLMFYFESFVHMPNIKLFICLKEVFLHLTISGV